MATIGNLVNVTLKSRLINLIQAKGPMTIAEYMKIVLASPSHGFYMNNDVFGVKGHFTTSPEISQVFGEILGAWILHEWHRFGCPKPLRLIEFGPGRGTLMADIIRTISKIQKDTNLQVGMVEISPFLRDTQKKTITSQDKQIANQAKWFETVEHIDESSEGFSAFVAHEYLDALPIHKFVVDPQTKNWRELVIDFDKNQNLIFAISKSPSLSTKLLIPKGFRGDHIEVCPQAASTLNRVADLLNRSKKGCMLVCDYGFDMAIDSEGAHQESRPNRDTFRAFKNHKPWHPLMDPGEADLTADVDFSYLKNHLNDRATVFGTICQSEFLMRCGFRQRLDVLLSNASQRGKESLISGSNMIVNEMGQRYKFLAIFPKDSKPLFDGDPPAGFYNSKFT